MKTKFILVLLFVLVIFSCSENEQKNDLQQTDESEMKGLGKAIGAGLENLRIDFNRPVTYHYSNLEEREAIIRNIIRDIYEVELRSSISPNGETVSDEFAVDIVINELTNTLILYPEPINQIVVPNPNTTYGDDKDCGGKAGDGWKSYGVCMSEVCVETKSKEAVSALSNSLTSGKCLDIRVKRNTFNARVCARLISC